TISEKQYTARDLAATFGCSVNTIHRHANKLFGESQNGVTRYFDKARITLLLESIKKSAAERRGAESVNLERSVQGVETGLTLDLQIAIAEKAAKELWKRKAEQNEARAVKAEAALGRLTIEHQDTLKANTQLWNIAEITGAITMDREDMLALYQR
ncbi:MAG: hypothetical protein LBK00_11055, partial [Treponema sp.]|nr:hypothetical protein [Treponema sp.]